MMSACVDFTEEVAIMLVSEQNKILAAHTHQTIMHGSMVVSSDLCTSPVHATSFARAFTLALLCTVSVVD